MKWPKIHKVVVSSAMDSATYDDTTRDYVGKTDSREQKRPVEGTSLSSKIVAYFLSLRVLTLVAMYGIALSSLVILSGIGYGYFAQSFNKNIHLLRKSIFLEISSYTETTLRRTTDVAASAAMTVQQGFVNGSDHASVRSFTWNMFHYYNTHGFDMQTAVYCVRESGYFQGFEIVRESGHRHEISSWGHPLTMTLTPVIDDDGNVKASSATSFNFKDFDDAVGELYHIARNTHKASWAPGYTRLQLSSSLWISFIVPFFDSTTNDWLGYYGVDIKMEQISKFYYEQTKHIDDSVVIVLERSTGYLVATSDLSIPLYRAEGNQSIRNDGTDVNNTLVRKSLEYFRVKYGERFERYSPTLVSLDKFKFKNEIFFSHIGSIQDQYGIDWILIRILPRDEFYHEFFNSIAVLATVTGAILIGSGVFSIFTSHMFVRPLNKLIEQTGDVENMNLENAREGLKSFSRMTEIRTLQAAFGSMVKKLMLLRSFIPDHILAALESNADFKLKDGGNTENMFSSSGESSNENTLGKCQRDTFSLGLNQGRVSIMEVKLVNFQRILQKIPVNEATVMFKDIVTQIQSIVRITNGQFVKTGHYHMTIVWNAQVLVDDHIEKACRAASLFEERIRKCEQTWKNKNLPSMTYQLSIATSPVLYGNLGTEKLKFFTIIGQCMELVSQMGSYAQQWGVNVAVDSFVHEKIQNQYVTRPLEFLNAKKKEKVMMYELGELKKHQADEWMYELEQENKYTRWDSYSKAHFQFQAGKVEEARKRLQEFIEDNPDDQPAKTLLRKIEESKSANVITITPFDDGETSDDDVI